MKAGLRVRGGGQLARKVLDQVTREHFALTENAAEDWTDDVLKDAADHAPVKTGTLKRSGRKYKARRRKGGKFANFNQIKMTFGVRRRKRKRGKRDRARADYAAAVHNNQSLKLRRGEHQFLYKALGRKKDQIGRRVVAKWRSR